jgi:hypothetical protein
MFITACFLAAIATSSQGAVSQTPIKFLEQIVASEVILQLDRRDVKATKNSKQSLKVLGDDANIAKAMIQSYEDANLASLPSDAPEELVRFKISLDKFKSNLDVDKMLTMKSVANGAEAKMCCDHDTSYLALLLSALKAPGISVHKLNAPAQYNISPVLYERNIGLIYAEPTVTDQALISPRIVRKGSKLRKGDVIVAVRGDDEKEWTPVKTWADVLKASNNFETGEGDVFVQVSRNNTIKNLTMVSSTVIVNTE